MTTLAPPRHAILWDSLQLGEVQDRRFRRILLSVALPILVLALVVSFLHLSSAQKGGGNPIGTPDSTTVRLLPTPPAPIAPKAEEPKPTPKPEEKPQPEPKPAPKPTPEPRRRATAPVPRPAAPTPPKITARERAQRVAKQSGLDALAALSDTNIAAGAATRPLVSGQLTTQGSRRDSGSTARAFERSAGASADAGSAGVGSAPVTHAQSGTGVGQRRTATVTSAIGFGRDKSRPGDNGKNLKAGRTLSEIQQVFDRNKAAFYALYNAALRRNPNEQGKIVVSLTIAPNGRVTDCHVVYNNMGDKTLEAQVVARVKMLDFGAKAVPVFTYPNYPIHFVPPS
ncbi:MAG: TonB family protein [Nevskiaceae bacterium]|nr:MAG: TonB family protein [Nevskiaceae bacterium]TBR74132.1 MAG: TonB family protein [Nevskiaceae bacterium]